jgi:hypothetical protein
MGLRGIVAAGLKAGFKAAGDIPVDITYRVAFEGSDDDRGTPSVKYVDHPIERVFVLAFSNKEILANGGLIAPGDRKLIIENWRLEEKDIVPKKTDQCVLDDGTYGIENPKKDPTGSAHFLQVRQV